MGHSAVLFGDCLVIFGGRRSPAQPLADVWALDLITHTWQCIACKGDLPTARYRHTAVALGSQAKVECFLPVTCLLAGWLAGWLSVGPSVCLFCLSASLHNMCIRQLPMPTHV